MSSLSINPLYGRRILLAEDDWFDAMEFTKHLVDAGADVIGPTATLNVALELAGNAAALDAAVLDIHLMDGLAFPVADVLAKRTVPFAFVTGYDLRDVVKSHAGARCHEKPCDCLTIVTALLTASDS